MLKFASRDGSHWGHGRDAQRVRGAASAVRRAVDVVLLPFAVAAVAAGVVLAAVLAAADRMRGRGGR